MIFAYTRVSTVEQNTDRQIIALTEYAQNHDLTIDRTFTDKVTGKHFKRPQYQAMKSTLRTGDTLMLKELDRMGRDMEQIKIEWNELAKMGVDIIVTDTPILNTINKSDLEKTLISNIVFELLSYMAEKERVKILSRQAEGIAIAKVKGKYKGRKPIECNNFTEIYTQWKAGLITGVKAMELTKLTKPTFYRKVKEYEKRANNG